MRRALLHCLVVGLCLVGPVVSVATPPAQKAALVALYESTNGPTGSWDPQCSAGWASTSDACTWYGVACDGDGNIAGVTLASCGLRGSLPSALDDLMFLSVLNVFSNNLTGTLPQFTAGLPNLMEVSLQYNALSGTLPPSWALSRQLHTVRLQHNSLTGSLPPSWGTNLTLTTCIVSHNMFSGHIPESWLSFLVQFSPNPEFGSELDVSHNDLTGSLPQWKGDGGVSFGTFKANFNALSGTLPSWANVVSFQTLELKGNHLDGTLPLTWSTMPGTRLDVSANRLWGTLGTGGDGSGALMRIREVYLQDNQFSGSLDNFTSGTASIFNISGNFFSGPLSTFNGDTFCQTFNLQGCQCTIDLSNNDLTGTLPVSWCALKTNVLLSGNCFSTGTAPCGADPDACTVDMSMQRKECK